MTEITKALTQAIIIEPIKMARSDHENLIPIVGSGVSLPLGLPNWLQFVQNLAQRANIASKDLENMEPPDALKEIKHKMGDTFAASVQHELRLPGAVTSTTLQALATVPIKRIITTNLDHAIEIAFAKAGQPLRPENVGRGYSTEELTLFDRQSDEPILLKIHGSLERPSTWVLTRSDYNQAYVNPGHLKNFLSAKIPISLFIGFSFSDRDVDETLRLAKSRWWERAYAIIQMEKLESYEFQARLQTMGVIPIGFFTYDQIPEIVDEIFQCAPLSWHYRIGGAEIDIPQEIWNSKEKLNRISWHYRIGGAEIDIPQEIWNSKEKLNRMVQVLSNALEVQPNYSIVDNKPRRKHGSKGWYRDEVIKILNEGDTALLQVVLKAMVQFPEIIFESLIPSLLRKQEVDHFIFFDTFFNGMSQVPVVCERMEQILLSNLHNSDLDYKCLREIAKVLAQKEIHPAMKIPPLTVRIGNLLVPIYPLTRYQVGLLLNNSSLQSENPVRPYTLQSAGLEGARVEIQTILKKLCDATGQRWRLPSSAEWIRVAQVSVQNPWPWGKDNPEFKTHAHLNYIEQGGNVANHPLEVGIFPKGQSINGLLDLVGNVYEVVTTDSALALAGGAWTTTFKAKSKGKFQMISGWAKGKNNVGLRAVLDADGS